MGILQYHLSLEEIKIKIDCLKNKNQWCSDGPEILQFPKLRYLSKQFIPTGNSRLNNILKNNFHSGSYILEFFDEDKSNVSFLLKSEQLNKFNYLCDKIRQYIPIDLSVARDRVGNFIFQFPITLLDIESKALPTWEGVNLKFTWHHLLSDIPDCLLQVESTFDNNYMGCTIDEYNKTVEQKVNIGNLDQINHIKIWRKYPSLILYNISGTFIRDFNIDIGICKSEPRIFDINGNTTCVEVFSREKNHTDTRNVNYKTYISNNLYDIEKKRLESSLSFKQYKEKNPNALNDLRTLIKDNDKNGVYLWDPFLRPEDILNTLYYSPTAGVPLKAIGAITDTVKTIYKEKGKTTTDIISEYRNQFENPKNNNVYLNLEFRVQHTNFGQAFHDRFLIFPGEDEMNKPKVYSLGTSINSYGQSHHVLHEVSHPQPVIDAFNELWNKLNNKDCIVWKHPK